VSKSTNFSTYAAATTYAKSRLGKVKRNPNGDGWVVETSEQQKIQPSKPKVVIPKRNSNSHQIPKLSDGWVATKKGAYYKKTSKGTYWVVKSSNGGWYLRLEDTDSIGFCYATADLAMKKGNQILSEKVKEIAPRVPRKALPEPKSSLPPSKPINIQDLIKATGGYSSRLCTRCGNPIPKARVDLMPNVLRCVNCQSGIEITTDTRIKAEEDFGGSRDDVRKMKAKQWGDMANRGVINMAKRKK